MHLSIKRTPSLFHLLWLFPFLLFAPALLGGRALIWGTPSLQFIPWRYLAWEQLSAGVWPFWNPLNGMGAPLLANYQLALYYPPGWLLFAFQAAGGAPCMAWGYTLLLAAHLAWGGYGMARLSRRLGLGELAQVVAGLAFSLSGYLVARAGFFSMIWSAAWLPWLILSVEQITGASRRVGWVGILALCAGMQLLSGHAQLTWYSLLFTGCWALVAGWNHRGWKGMLSVAGWTAAGMLAGAGLAAVQLIPTYELLLQSQRASAVGFDFATTYSFWPWRFLTLLAPSFFGNPAIGDYWGYGSYWEDAIYIGLLPCLMAFSTLRLIWRPVEDHTQTSLRRSRVRLLWGMAAAGAILALGKNTPVFPFLYQHVPTFDMFQAPARYMLWPVFSLSVLAGIGVEGWQRPIGKALRATRRGLLAVLAGMVGAGLAYFVLPGIKPSFIYSTATLCAMGALVAWLGMRKPLDPAAPKQNRWTWLVAGFVGLDLLLAGWGQNPTTPAQFYATSSGSATINQTGEHGRIYLDEQSEYRLKFDRFLRFEDYRPRESWENMRLANIPNLNILNGTPSVNNFDPMRPARYEDWMVHLAALPAEERAPWLRAMDVDRVQSVTGTDRAAYTVEPLSGGERFRFYSCAHYVRDDGEAWEKTGEVIEQGANEVVIEGEGLVLDCNPQSDDKIYVRSEHATRIELDVEVERDGWLLMADTWYPGWHARVDGHSAPLHRANYLFRAVPLSAGSHQIIIEYHPDWLWPSVGVSLLSLAGIILLLFPGRKRQSIKWSSNGRTHL